MKTKMTLRIPADDRIARFTFSDTTRAAGLIREFLPRDLVASLDLSKLKLLPDQHIDKHLREHRDDLNMECPAIPNGKVFIRILVEHKSIHDPNLWFQLLRSIVVTWMKTGFCPVIPIVLHTGSEPFRFAIPQDRIDWVLQNPFVMLCHRFPYLQLTLQVLPWNVLKIA
jgi:hypothetical protein